MCSLTNAISGSVLKVGMHLSVKITKILIALLNIFLNITQIVFKMMTKLLAKIKEILVKIM